jgi:hypothetical protein
MEDFLASPRTKNALVVASLALKLAFVVHLACCVWVRPPPTGPRSPQPLPYLSGRWARILCLHAAVNL